jgi:hypothetical protein
MDIQVFVDTLIENLFFKVNVKAEGLYIIRSRFGKGIIGQCLIELLS